MTKAVRVHKVGGPEALVYEAVEVPAPGAGEVRIRQHAVGLNFIDVYYRTGLYKAPGLPFIVGNEAAGEVLAVGPGVTHFHPGDRVAYYFNLGGYASERNIPWRSWSSCPTTSPTSRRGADAEGADGLVSPAQDIQGRAGTSGSDSRRRRGHRVARMPVGQGARRARHRTVGTRAKADLALANGCDHVILYNDEDFVARVKQISRNELCDVVTTVLAKPRFPVRCPASGRAGCS